jgi:hypothetical protein
LRSAGDFGNAAALARRLADFPYEREFYKLAEQKVS